RWRSTADGSYRWFLGRATAVRDAAGRIGQWHGTTTDIHDQRRLRDDLESSQRRLALALESGGLGMWHSEAPFRGAIANEACKRHYGLDPSDEFGPDGWLEQVHPDDRAGAVQAIAESTQTGRPLDLRYRVAGRDGVDRYVRVAARVTLDDEGRPRRLDGVTIDLSAERERAEVFARAADFARLLSESSELLSSSLDYQQTLANLTRLVVPRMADWCAIDLADGEGRLKRLAVAHVDPAKVALAHELSRRWPPDPARDPSHRVLRGGAAELVEEVPDELLASLALDDEHLAVLRSLGLRSWMIVPLVARQRRLGVLILVNEARSRSFTRDDLACAEDLARRAGMAIDNASLLAESERARNEAESMLLVNRSVAGELDRDRLLQTVTDAGVRATGAQFGAFFYNDMDEKGGKYLLYALSGAPRSAFDQFPLPRATALFGPTFRGEGVIRSGDIHRDPRYGRNSYGGMPAGHLPVVSYLAVPVRSRNGEVLGGLFFGHGEPDRFSEHHERLAVGIADQAAVAADNVRLFQGERAARLALASHAEDLGRANSELEQFAYIASHDLQEPLRTVTQFLDLLGMRYGERLDDRGRQYMRYASDSASRMYDLINDLLGFSRLKRREELQDVALGVIAAEVVQDLAAQVAATSARVEIGALPTVPGEGPKLRQLLQNLIGNALKFHGERPPVVFIDSAADGSGWTITVRDNGIGIEEQHHERVFEVFQRLHGREQYPGNGIGLAVCKKIVEQHGGRIWVESGSGTGASFRFTLPRGGQESTSP
ncbi:MAG: GAF domain-containing protein, partial [Planctomycetes bacterium]|nr:GAF domain-containing protein [Planctomycetota bacterium]